MRWSTRTGRTIFPAWIISRPVGLVFMTVVAVNRELRKRSFWHVLRPEPDLLDSARSGSARHRRRRGAAEGTEPRLRVEGPDRDAPARACRADRADGCGAAHRPARAAGISAFCSGRASMRAGASAAPISARGCCSKTIRPKPAQSRPNSTGSIANARRSSRRHSREAEAEAMAALGHRGKGRGGGDGRAGLAPGRRRAGRGAAEGALRPPRFRDRA